jgi:hypothetical protein
LDGPGTEFYLPVLLVAVLDDPSYRNYRCLVDWLTPRENEPDAPLYDLFRATFDKFTGPKKAICLEVLQYVLANLHQNDPLTKRQIEELLAHEYWKSEC